MSQHLVSCHEKEGYKYWVERKPDSIEWKSKGLPSDISQPDIAAVGFL